jgi:hypothetical protein
MFPLGGALGPAAAAAHLPGRGLVGGRRGGLPDNSLPSLQAGRSWARP